MDETDRVRVLVEVYKSYLEHLEGFRDTFFKVASILVAILLAFVAGIVQFKQVYLILLLPLPIIILIVSTIGYAGWRGELIRVAANVEKNIGPAYLPEDCCYQSTFLKNRGIGEREGHGFPGGLNSKRIAVTVLLSSGALAIYYYYVIPFLPTLKLWLEAFK